MAQHVDFFFFYGSTYTYLSVMRIEECAAQSGIKVRWRPFNVREIMIEQDNVPFRDKPVKMSYMWRDIERRAQRYGIPYEPVPPYPVDPDALGNRVGVVAASQGWCEQYTKAVYRDWFLEHKAIGDPQHLAAILQALGKDPAAVIASADSDEIRDRYAAETNVARNLGIFGSPTFLVANEIFWGDDRLEDALEWASSPRD